MNALINTSNVNKTSKIMPETASFKQFLDGEIAQHSQKFHSINSISVGVGSGGLFEDQNNITSAKAELSDPQGMVTLKELEQKQQYFVSTSILYARSFSSVELSAKVEHDISTGNKSLEKIKSDNELLTELTAHKSLDMASDEVIELDVTQEFISIDVKSVDIPSIDATHEEIKLDVTQDEKINASSLTTSLQQNDGLELPSFSLLTNDIQLSKKSNDNVLKVESFGQNVTYSSSKSVLWQGMSSGNLSQITSLMGYQFSGTLNNLSANNEQQSLGFRSSLVSFDFESQHSFQRSTNNVGESFLNSRNSKFSQRTIIENNDRPLASYKTLDWSSSEQLLSQKMVLTFSNEMKKLWIRDYFSEQDFTPAKANQLISRLHEFSSQTFEQLAVNGKILWKSNIATNNEKES